MRRGPDGATFPIDPSTMGPGQRVYITGDETLTTLGVRTGTGAPACPPKPGG